MEKKLQTSFFSYLKYLYFEFATKLNRSYWFESVKITDLDYPFNSSRYKSFERKTASFFPSFFRPNPITFLRILISFILVASADDLSYFSVFSLTVFGGLTDFIDGVLARSRNQKTRIGILLDPLADKMLMLSVLYVLVKRGLFDPLYIWLLIAFESHVIVIPLLSYFYQLIKTGHYKPVVSFEEHIKPYLLGRIKLQCYIYSVLLILIGTINGSVMFIKIGHYMFVLGLCAAFVSTIKYIIRWAYNPY